QNFLLGAKLSEYHTGFRAFSRKVLLELTLLENSDDFVFDNEMLAQCIYAGFRIGEVSCPTKYVPEASSINFRRSLAYGMGVVATTVKVTLHKWGLGHFRLFSTPGRKLDPTYYRGVASPPSSPQREHRGTLFVGRYSDLSLDQRLRPKSAQSVKAT